MQFARDHPDITVIGMGAGVASNGDSLDGAFAFAQSHGTSLPNMRMIYDVSYRSWRNFGVTNQPWAVGYAADGTQVFSQPGRVDLTSIAAALG